MTDVCVCAVCVCVCVLVGIVLSTSISSAPGRLYGSDALSTSRPGAGTAQLLHDCAV